MKTQITEIDDINKCSGKTIDKIEVQYNAVTVSFTDDTFLYLSADNEGTLCSETVDLVTGYLYAQRLGLATKEEIAKIKKQRDLERRAELRAFEKSVTDSRRRQYEELKKEFGG